MEENKMGKSTVTISIASYNNGAVIERCLDSAISQSYTDTEILIIDDGSTDDTLERLKKYDNIDNVRVIKKENGGLSSVRQRGLDEAKGNYICFIDADDYLEPTYIELLIKKIVQDNSDVCVCSTRMLYEKKDTSDVILKGFKCIESAMPIKYDPSYFMTLRPQDLLNLHLSDSWNKLYSVSFLKKTGVKFSIPKGYNGTDTFFNQLLFLHSPSYSSISSEEYVHILYNKSAVHRKNKDLLKTFQLIIREMINESQKLGFYNYQKPYIEKLYAIFLIEAFGDVDSELEDKRERRVAFRDMSQRNKSFVSDNLLSLDNSAIGTRATRFFLMLMKIRPENIHVYFRLLNMITSIRLNINVRK